MKAACFSVAAMDYYPQLKTTYPGGNSLNQSIRFRQMGHESAFVGAIGNDENGDRIMALLDERMSIPPTCSVTRQNRSNQLLWMNWENV